MVSSGDGGAWPLTPAIRETAVAKVMTSTSIGRHPTAFHTTGLPILQAALDVDHMSERLAPLLSSRPRRARYANLVAYKQGNRGLVRYELSDGPEDVVLGKIYPDAQRAEQVGQIMAELEAKAFPADQPDIAIPHVLGCVPELCMLVYVPVEGPYLDELDDEPFLANLGRAARWLARLHGSPVHLERRLQLKAEVVNVRAWSAIVAHKYPEEGEVAAALALRVQHAFESLPFERVVPIHKDFHYRHLIVDSGNEQRPPRLAVIDFDEVRLGEPAFDVSHLCAHLELLALRRPLPRPTAELQERFLAAYAEASPGWAPGPYLVCFHAYTCLKIAKQLCTTRGVRPRPDGEEERRQVHEVLRAELPPSGREA